MSDHGGIPRLTRADHVGHDVALCVEDIDDTVACPKANGVAVLHDASPRGRRT